MLRVVVLGAREIMHHPPVAPRHGMREQNGHRPGLSEIAIKAVPKPKQRCSVVR
jgi:hypothetical protein